MDDTYYLHPPTPTARAIFLNDNIQCNGMCCNWGCITQSGGGGGGGGGSINGQDPILFLFLARARRISKFNCNYAKTLSYAHMAFYLNHFSWDRISWFVNPMMQLNNHICGHGTPGSMLFRHSRCFLCPHYKIWCCVVIKQVAGGVGGGGGVGRLKHNHNRSKFSLQILTTSMLWRFIISNSIYDRLFKILRKI